MSANAVRGREDGQAGLREDGGDLIGERGVGTDQARELLEPLDQLRRHVVGHDAGLHEAEQGGVQRDPEHGGDGSSSSHITRPLRTVIP
ncbi:hypothetical protein ACFPIJ_33830 [Dactylosporangium cerinum]|uniref:Uncharacterized protein n=1 Tax=Dactylosporangium cerinum TaxID=1434730 RepID=A0ABV9W527_9ACTN